MPGDVRCANAEQQVTGISDTGITEQAFEVPLWNCTQVSIQNRDDRHNDQQLVPILRDGWNRTEKHSQQKDKASGLRSDSKKRCHRRGRTLVNVGSTDLKRERGDLEAESNQHHKDAE